MLKVVDKTHSLRIQSQLDVWPQTGDEPPSGRGKQRSEDNNPQMRLKDSERTSQVQQLLLAAVMLYVRSEGSMLPTIFKHCFAASRECHAYAYREGVHAPG